MCYLAHFTHNRVNEVESGYITSLDSSRPQFVGGFMQFHTASEYLFGSAARMAWSSKPSIGDCSPRTKVMYPVLHSRNRSYCPIAGPRQNSCSRQRLFQTYLNLVEPRMRFLRGEA